MPDTESNNTDTSRTDAQSGDKPTIDDGTRPKIQAEYPRRGGIRLQTNRNDVVLLDPLVTEALDTQNGIDRVEILEFFGDAQQEVVVIPKGARSDVQEQMSKVEQQKLTETTTPTTAERDEHDPLLGALKSAFESSGLEDVLGYDVCDVDLAPLERTVRSTCRLVVARNPDLRPLAKRRPHPTEELLADLVADNLPYLLQTIVSTGGRADYELTQRLVVYSPADAIGLDADYADVMTGTRSRVDLSDYYGPKLPSITSNYDLDDHRFFQIDRSGTGVTVEPRQDRDDISARRARRILEGKIEYHRMLAGMHSTNQDLQTLYQHRDYYTKIPVDSGALRGFLAFVPFEFDHSPWDRVLNVEQPRLITRPEMPPPEPGSSATTERTYVTQGGQGHRDLEDRVELYFEERGFAMHRPDTDTSASVPDFIVESDETYFVECEYANESQPANVLINAARAAYHDIPVLFFAENNAVAQSLLKILRDPVKAHTETGAKLYTRSNRLTLASGGRPVLPPDASESHWYLHNDDPDATARLELRADGRVLASGPVDESVAEWTYDTEVFPSEKAVPDDRTQVHPPIVPTKLTYLADTQLWYEVQTHEFVRMAKDEIDLDWDVPDEAGKRKRYAGAFEGFLDQTTIPVEGAELLRDEVIEACLTQYYEPQTDRKAPGRGTTGEAGRALWKHAERKENNPEDQAGKIVKLADCTWRFPRGVISPDLPFVGSEQAVERYLD